MLQMSAHKFVLFQHYPMEVGNHREKVVLSQTELLSEINWRNGKENCFLSVYGGFRLDEKGKPMFQTAVIDKMFFDFDKQSYDVLLAFHEFLKTKKLAHVCLYSGGGFHLYLLTKPHLLRNPRAALKTACYQLLVEAGLVSLVKEKIVDPCVLGDIARHGRFPNTWNPKRGCFCIPLLEEDIQKGLDHIKKLAEKQRLEDNNYVVGEKLFSLLPFDTDPEPDIGESASEDGFSLNVVEQFKREEQPHPFNEYLADSELGNQERFSLICFLKEQGFFKSETVEILRRHLSPQKFKHCVYGEKQVEYVYRRM